VVHFNQAVAVERVQQVQLVQLVMAAQAAQVLLVILLGDLLRELDKMYLVLIGMQAAVAVVHLLLQHLPQAVQAVAGMVLNYRA
jgi:hypothetical protein